MRARELNKRVEIWQTTKVADSYGGNTIEEVLVSTTWAKLETQEGQTVSDLGLDYTKGTVLVTVRNRNDIDYNSTTLYLKYRSEKYNIVTFPTNENFTDAFLTFTMVKVKPATFTV